VLLTWGKTKTAELSSFAIRINNVAFIINMSSNQSKPVRRLNVLSKRPSKLMIYSKVGYRNVILSYQQEIKDARHQGSNIGSAASLQTVPKTVCSSAQIGLIAFTSLHLKRKRQCLVYSLYECSCKCLKLCRSS